MNNVVPAIDVALPHGVDILNQEPFEPGLDGKNTYRIIWSLPAAVPDHMVGLDIRLGATQLSDGTIVSSHGEHEAPTIYVGGHDFPVPDARALAIALLSLADLADTWTGNPVPVKSALATAAVALRASHVVLRTLPGNADSYVAAALDSISDATEALQ